MSIITKKICLVGDFGVGKTSLMRRFVDRQFSDQYLSTIGVKISRKVVQIAEPHGIEPQEVRLLIWDLEGQTKFQSINSGYLQGSAGAIIVADLSRQDTIDRLQEHLKLVCGANPRGVKLVVAFNKSDLLAPEKLATFQNCQQSPVVNRQGEAALARDPSQALHTYITSAKTGNNVDEIFQKIARLTLQKP